MEKAEYEVMYRVEEDYWWYVGLHRLLLAWIERVANGRRLRVLDAGCGTGRLLALLSDHDARGVELAPEAFPFLARRGLANVVRGSITELSFPDTSFDLVVSADVACCVGPPGDAKAFAEMARVLAPGGVLLLHLPAFPALHGEHDRAVHIRRRYRRPELAAMLRGAGLAVTRLTYRVSFLFPIAAPARLLTRIGLSGKDEARSDLRALPGTINRALTAVLLAENRTILSGFDLPIGLSVFAVAEKRK